MVNRMKSHQEDERKKALATRGKKAQDITQDFLEKLKAKYRTFDFLRLSDARSAGGRAKAMPGDFEFFRPGIHGILEVKQTKHNYRISKKDIPQIPKLRRREMAGGHIVVLIYHSEMGMWRVPSFEIFRDNPIAPSWDLSAFRTYETIKAALTGTWVGPHGFGDI